MKWMQNPMTSTIQKWSKTVLITWKWFNITLDDYGPKSYPVMIAHDGYIKSAQYHLDNFNDDDGLVYDSVRGCNLHSPDCGNLLVILTSY